VLKIGELESFLCIGLADFLATTDCPCATGRGELIAPLLSAFN
jgi:hypothetical protein